MLLGARLAPGIQHAVLRRAACRAQAAGLSNFVEWNVRRDIDGKVSELQEALVDMISGDSDVPPQEVLAQVKARKDEHKLPDRCACACVWVCVQSRGCMV